MIRLYREIALEDFDFFSSIRSALVLNLEDQSALFLRFLRRQADFYYCLILFRFASSC